MFYFRSWLDPFSIVERKHLVFLEKEMVNSIFHRDVQKDMQPIKSYDGILLTTRELNESKIRNIRTLSP